jgi:hypothetical protein
MNTFMIKKIYSLLFKREFYSKMQKNKTIKKN